MSIPDAIEERIIVWPSKATAGVVCFLLLCHDYPIWAAVLTGWACSLVVAVVGCLIAESVA